MSGLGFIKAEKPQQCDMCGEIAELRPYGPRGETVCHKCAMRDKIAAQCGFLRYVFGEACKHNPKHGAR